MRSININIFLLVNKEFYFYLLIKHLQMRKGSCKDYEDLSIYIKTVALTDFGF